MHDVVTKNLNKLSELCLKHKVDRIHLFGSQAKGDFGEKSDIDLLVKFSESIDVLDYSDSYFDLLESLEKLFERKVDLVSERSLKNPILIHEIEQTKIALL